jgi:transposase InsO family protein
MQPAAQSEREAGTSVLIFSRSHETSICSAASFIYDRNYHKKRGETIMNEQNQLAQQAKVAQFRFALIAPVVQGLFPDASKAAYFKRVSENPLTLPDGTVYKYGYKTLEKWEYLYRIGGFDALMPKSRCDKGLTRALPDTCIEEIFRLKEAFPRLNATQIHARLVSESFIPATVNVCAVQRFIRNNDLKSARNPNMKDRKAFEEDSFGKMWQADTCYFPYITEDGKSRRVYCLMIIDEHSRLLTGGELFYNDNAANFQKVLKHAVCTYGIPSKLYVDWGGPYSNEQLSLICGSLGIALIHTPVRDGASKAKVERHFRSMKERWLYGLELEAITSLEQFNQLLAEYMRTYNTTYHTGISQTPFERFTGTKSQIRIPKSREWLDECFLNRITRKVKKDATVSIDNECYDVPMQFIGVKVEIRFNPSDAGSAFILHDGGHFPLRPTDKQANCRTKRQNGISLDYAKIGGGR